MLDWMAWDGRIILLEKVARTVPYGFLAVLFPIYLSQLGFDAFLIGVVLTLTVATSAGYTFVASFVADRLGRRRTLIFFAMTDAIAGALLLASAAWWAPIAARFATRRPTSLPWPGRYRVSSSLPRLSIIRTSRRPALLKANKQDRTRPVGLVDPTGVVEGVEADRVQDVSPILGRCFRWGLRGPGHSILFLLPALPSRPGFAGTGVLSRPNSNGSLLSDRRKDRQMDRPHQHNGLHTHTIQHSPHRHPLRPNGYTGCDSATLQTISLADGRADATVLPDERGPRIGQNPRSRLHKCLTVHRPINQPVSIRIRYRQPLARLTLHLRRHAETTVRRHALQIISPSQAASGIITDQ